MSVHARNGISAPARKPRMWPRTAAAAAACCCLLAASAAPAEARALRLGDRGRDVITLQQLLHLHPDGVFGAGTKRAVIRFQRAHHLRADGLAGIGTVTALRRANRKASGSGGSASSGPRVRRLQQALGIAADGRFGPGTQSAVKAFQRSHGLTADGVVGQSTWRALGLGHFTKPALRRKSGSPLRRSGGGGGRLARMFSAGNRIASLPYIYGGGHASFTASGYDCSGSVSYVLHAAGLLGTPYDSSRLMSYGLPGRGRYVTIYSNPGHVFMVIRGHRFDTSGLRENGSRWARRGRSTDGYVARHPAGL